MVDKYLFGQLKYLIANNCQKLNWLKALLYQPPFLIISLYPFTPQNCQLKRVFVAPPVEKSKLNDPPPFHPLSSKHHNEQPKSSLAKTGYACPIL